MCGILGVVGPRPVDPARLDGVALLRHRGPDGEGRYMRDHVGLAMRRLAIIDLETGDQPVANEAGDVVCITNGELYNYRELRAELGAKGHVFRGEGDIEVVPHL
jgi:asparagine synthase (glutamine-hydrolysing)